MGSKSSKSSGRWLQEHFSDPYVKQAQKDGFRSRAIYKLKEIDERDHLFKPGMKVVDLGAAPGSWAQYVVKRIQPKGRLIASDILPIEPVDGVDILQGDFTEEASLHAILALLAPDRADWVISDMAPNMSGVESVDIPRAIYLGELALDLAQQVLQPGGGFLTKTFQGEGFDAFLGQIKSLFKHVAIRKPKASRGRSREVFILARQLKA